MSSISKDSVLQSSEVSNLFVPESQTSVEIVPENEDRIKLILINQSNKDMFLAYNKTASLNEGIILKGGETWIESNYTGVINGIWKDKADSGVEIIEITR